MSFISMLGSGDTALVVGGESFTGYTTHVSLESDIHRLFDGARGFRQTMTLTVELMKREDVAIEPRLSEATIEQLLAAVNNKLRKGP